METQKLSFDNIHDELSRNEMKNILAGTHGSGGGGGDCGPYCGNCVEYAPGDPPCYKFECDEYGFCVPKESDCCIIA